MIVRMTRARIAGPRDLLDRLLALLQDLGVLHVVRPLAPEAGLALPGVAATRRAKGGRDAPRLARILADVETALAALPPLDAPGVRAAERAAPRPPASIPAAARVARRVRRRAEALSRRRAALLDERALLLRYREFFAAFGSLLEHELRWPDGQAFYVVLRAGAEGALEPLRRNLEAAAGRELELLGRPLPSGETAVLLLASAEVAPRVARMLAESRVHELPAPAGLGEPNLLRAYPALQARLAAIPEELGEVEAQRDALRDEHAAGLASLRAWLHDRILLLEARGAVLAGEHLFVVEGWLPSGALPALAERAARELGPEVVVEAVATESWSRGDAPVALSNPPLFRPFEIVTRMVPLPRYGTIDPTPFVAVFFPMFFGLMLGDAGYGVMLGVLAVVLRLQSRPATTLRSVSAVAGACAAFTILFGLVFGEMFGTLGHRLGMRPLVFDRGEAILPFLGLAIALGVVHVVLGLVLAVAGAWRRGLRREAMGRGVAALMVLLTVAALLAAFEVLPDALFTPFAIAVLVTFPVLVALEGVAAVVELLSTYGHVLSYARIMALGTASLMLAVVANEMVGAMGSVFVGVLFALLFHLVNFVIGLFSPTIHALRLHYVEFFGKFLSPGGTAYRPLAHWRLADAAHAPRAIGIGGDA